MEHLQKFLLELGSGFAFVGRQVHLEIGDSDFYIDLKIFSSILMKDLNLIKSLIRNA